MLTPQEVAEHAFTKAAFSGYNMAMVDEFLDQVTSDYTALYKENTTLKSKMKVLADKVEEYRATEDAMRRALMTAQRMADQMVAEAEKQRASILQGAEAEAREKIGSLRREAENENARLLAARSATSEYIAKLKELYQHEIDYIGSLSELEADVPKPDRVADAADSIASAVEKAIEEELPTEEAEEPAAEPPEEPAAPAAQPEEPKEDDEEEDTSPTRRIDFEHLKFGKDYRIE